MRPGSTLQAITITLRTLAQVLRDGEYVVDSLVAAAAALTPALYADLNREANKMRTYLDAFV